MAKAPATVTYDDLDAPSGSVEIADLFDGEIGCSVTKLAERTAAGTPIIELTCQIFYTGAEGNPNEEFVGKEFTTPVFLGKNSALTITQLKQFFRAGGFDVGSWKRTEDGGELPMSKALPGAIKLLFTKKIPFLAKITTSTKDGVDRKFLNFKKILRENPETGEAYEGEHSLPLPVPNELIAEAFNTKTEAGTAKDVI